MESIIKGNFIIIIFARVELSDFFFSFFVSRRRGIKSEKEERFVPKSSEANDGKEIEKGFI